MNSRHEIVKSVWFISALLILLLNDFIFKDLFHNFITGKLSDFSGLLAFALFWINFFPKKKMHIILGTALLFIFWKSTLSDGFIQFWNSHTLLPIQRVVDYGDLMALSILPLALIISNRPISHRWKFSVHPILPIFLACFAFGATSYDENFDYNKTYEFAFSKEELIERMNALEADSTSINHPFSLHVQNSNHASIDHMDSLYFHASKFYLHIDTIFRSPRRKVIDTIYRYNIPVIDSAYIDYENTTYINFRARKYMKESTTGYCESIPARIKIEGKGNKSSITLLKIFTHNCMGMFEKEAKNNERENLLKAFEEEIIKKL